MRKDTIYMYIYIYIYNAFVNNNNTQFHNGKRMLMTKIDLSTTSILMTHDITKHLPNQSKRQSVMSKVFNNS